MSRVWWIPAPLKRKSSIHTRTWTDSGLAIFAVPLARSQPRAGRYGRLAIGLLVFIVYFNLLSAAKAWVEKGEIDPTLGLWWVHGIFLLAALGLLAVQNSMHRRLFS